MHMHGHILFAQQFQTYEATKLSMQGAYINSKSCSLKAPYSTPASVQGGTKTLTASAQQHFSSLVLLRQVGR